MNRLILTCAAWVFLLGSFASAQNNPQATPADENATGAYVIPKWTPTQLEAIQSGKGKVITRGYTNIGTLQCSEDATIAVTALTVSDGQSSVSGLAIEIHHGSDRSVIAYVDEDEIDNLLSAIDSLAKLDHSATRLEQFDALYRTRGDLEVSSFDNGGARMIGVKCVQVLAPAGQIVWSNAYFPVTRMQDLTHQIQTGKEALARARDADNK